MVTAVWTQRSRPPANPPTSGDAVTDAQTLREVPITRSEQRKNPHDVSHVFEPNNAQPSSPAFMNQPEQSMFKGFDFARDPLDAKRPMPPAVMATQRKPLESRYNLTPRLDPEVKMSRGKPICVGPTARLAQGATWENLAQTAPDAIRKANAFPYHPLPHPKQTPGGFVFPQMQIQMFPACSVSTSIATCRKRFCRGFRRRSLCRSGWNSAMSRTARWSA